MQSFDSNAFTKARANGSSQVPPNRDARDPFAGTLCGFVIRRDSAEIVIGMWKLNGSQEFLFEHKQMAINSELPKKWSRGQQGFVVNDLRCE